MAALLDRVRWLADEVLFPSALEVDRTGDVPESHWQLLADEGMYGLAAPPHLGGPTLEFPEIVEGLETMAGGCLATTFTWVQHHGLVMGLASSPNDELRAELWDDVVSGRVRGGVAFAGVIPDPPRVMARRTAGGWSLTGFAPFVSGWGIVQLLQVSAGDEQTGDVIGVIVEAREQPGVTNVIAHDLVAANGTKTVSLEFADLEVSDERVVSRVPRVDFLANQIFGARLNGTFPLGLVTRCCQLLDEADRHEEAERLRVDRDAIRAGLDAGLADIDTMVGARADAALLATRASAALVAAGGGPSLIRSSHAQRLAREAVFTLVAASRAELKGELLSRLSCS